MSHSGPPTFLTGRQNLPSAVAARLAAGGSETFDDVLLVLPTMETGRRIVDALVRQANGRIVFPPRLATAFSLVPFGGSGDVASPIQAALAWREVLLAAADCPETFGEHSEPGARANLAPVLVELTRTLAAADHSISSAAGILAGRDRRWLEWERLSERYLAFLARQGWKCPAEAQRESAAVFSKPRGIHRIIVAGVPDLPPLAARALENAGAEIWIHAPGIDDPDRAFDRQGRARPEFWSARHFDFPDPGVFESLEDLAADAARRALAEPGRAAIICGDPGLSDEMESALAAAGGSGFQPEGHPLARHPVVQLGVRLARFGPHSAWDEMEALLRHPDFLAWLRRREVAVDFARWTTYGALALRPDVLQLRERFEDFRPKERERLSVVLPLITIWEDLAATESLPAERLRRILSEIYSDRNMAVRPGDKDAAKAVVQTLDEIRSVPGLSPLNGSDLAAILESIAGTWTPEKPAGAIEIEGWLEVAGEDASCIVLAGFNEGLLPSRRRIDPLLPDSAREALGLDHSASRETRDAALLAAASAIEGRSVVALAARRASDGSPLKPSRFLLRRPDAELPARVLHLCGEIPFERPPDVCDFRRAPLRLRRPERPVTAMNVTDFKAYLACPLRFHLSRRLEFSGPEDVLHRLDHAAFGNWLHQTLQAFGNEPAIRDSSDASEILDWLDERWSGRFAVYGEDVDLLLQKEAGRMRLESFAKVQAATRRDGWTIRHAEWRIASGENGLAIPGWPLALRGRIDRIDVRGEDVRVIDYKTGSVKSVRGEHVRKTRPDSEFGLVPDFARIGDDEHWTNLQLPLYATALRTFRPPDIPDTPPVPAYFILAEDSGKCGILDWPLDESVVASAESCAREIMAEVSADRVGEWIASRDFRRFAVDPDYDDFEPLALSAFIEAGALELEP